MDDDMDIHMEHHMEHDIVLHMGIHMAHDMALHIINITRNRIRNITITFI